MSFVDPAMVQDPTTNLVAVFGWGDAVNTGFNWLRAAKPGCHLTTVVGTAVTTDTPVPFATETFDTGACHSGGASTRITIPTGYTGLWLFSCNIRCTANIFTAWIVKSGATKIAGCSSITAGAVGAKTSVSTLYEATAADYFEVWVTGGSNIETGEASYFCGQFLHGS